MPIIGGASAKSFARVARKVEALEEKVRRLEEVVWGLLKKKSE